MTTQIENTETTKLLAQLTFEKAQMLALLNTLKKISETSLWLLSKDKLEIKNMNDTFSAMSNAQISMGFFADYGFFSTKSPIEFKITLSDIIEIINSFTKKSKNDNDPLYKLTFFSDNNITIDISNVTLESQYTIQYRNHENDDTMGDDPYTIDIYALGLDSNMTLRNDEFLALQNQLEKGKFERVRFCVSEHELIMKGFNDDNKKTMTVKPYLISSHIAENNEVVGRVTEFNYCKKLVNDLECDVEIQTAHDKPFLFVLEVPNLKYGLLIAPIAQEKEEEEETKSISADSENSDDEENENDNDTLISEIHELQELNKTLHAQYDNITKLQESNRELMAKNEKIRAFLEESHETNTNYFQELLDQFTLLKQKHNDLDNQLIATQKEISTNVTKIDDNQRILDE